VCALISQAAPCGNGRGAGGPRKGTITRRARG